MTNTLTYFRVDGSWRDVEQPIPSHANSIAPQENDVSCYVDFFPGLQKSVSAMGFAFLAANFETLGDTEVAIAPITARSINGKLCSITVNDPVGVQLVNNAPWMALGVDLYYHVRYRNVTYGGALQRFEPFAFKAPTDTTGVRITSTTLQRYDYYGP